MSRLLRMIISAAPTCTLWVWDFHQQVYRFRFRPNIYITSEKVIHVQTTEHNYFWTHE